MALKMRAVAKHTWLITLRLIALALIVLVLMLGILIGTEGGRISLVKQAINAYQVFSGQSLLVAGIRSPSIGDWQFSQIRIDQSPLVQLQVNDLEINWRWQYALQNRWWFTNISASLVAVQMGEPQPSSGGGFSNIYSLWEQFPSLRIERINITNLDVARPRYPNLTGSLNGQAEVNWGVIPARFLVSLTDASSGNEYASQLSANGLDQFRLQGSLSAQPNTSWARWLKWSLDEPAQASWDVLVNYGQTGQLSMLIDEWRMPWQSHLLTASGQVNYDVDNVEVSFLPLVFSLDGQPATLEGQLAALESNLSVIVDDWTLEPILSLAGLDDLTGQLSIDANWLGGWRQPRLNGSASANGQWQEFPFELQMNSVAARSSLQVETARLRFVDNEIRASGDVDWLTESLNLSIEGDANTGPFVRRYMPDLLREFNAAATFNGSVTGALQSPTIDVSTNLTGRWRDDPLQATLSGRWSDGEAQLNNFAIDSSLLEATGSADYQLGNHRWSVDGNVVQLSSDLLERFNISLPVVFDAVASGSVQANGEGSEFDVAGDVNLQGLWQQWPLDAQIALESLTKRGIFFNDSLLTLNGGSTDFNGNVRWADGALDLNLDHQNLPLALLPLWFSSWPDILSTFDGDLTGSTRVYGPWTRPAIQTTSEFNGQWFEQPMTLALQTQPDTNERWTIEQLDAQWLGAQWSYVGEFLPYELGMNGDIAVNNLSADSIPLLSREFTGSERSLPQTLAIVLEADMAILGSITEPVLSGAVTSSGQLDGLPLSVTADIDHLDTRYISIRQAQGNWASGSWSVEGLYDWSLGQASMDIETNTPDARPLIPWLQLALGEGAEYQWLETWQGSLIGEVQIDNRTDDWLINGDVRSAGDILSEAYQLQWTGEGRIRQALNHQLNASWGDSRVSMSLISSAEDIQGQIDVAGLTYGQLRPFVSAIPDTLNGDIDGQITLAGQLSAPNVDAQINTRGQLDGQRQHNFTTQLNVTSQDGQWTLQRTVLDIPEALTVTVEGEGEGMQGAIRIQGVMPNTLYWVPNTEIGSGEAVFGLDIDGDLNAPNLNGQIEWRGEQWPTNVLLTLATLEQSYQLEGTVLIDNLTRLKANVRAPQAPFSELIGNWQQQPVEVSMAVNAPTTVLDPFFVDLPDQQVGGNLSGSLSMTGRFAAPRWSGELAWTDGLFEHAEYGTRINDINLSITGEGQQLNLTAAATDGGQGRIALSGNVVFSDSDRQAFSHEMDLAIRVNNGQLLNQAQMDATVNGALNVTGSYSDMNVRGRMDITPLNMQTDTFLLDGAPQLNIVEANTNGSDVVTERPNYLPQGQLDVVLVANNRVNLYGQGINAELSGELSMRGDFYAPDIAGRFEIVRGTYTGFGRVFQLTGGAVQIQNNQLVLDVTGEYSQPDLDVTLRITGNQDELNLQLSSSNSMDQDELLAQLLFGRVVDELDVIQAIQLANVVNKLRTGDTGLDIIGATREELSLDALTVDTETDEEGNLAFNVSAGKYLNDFLYLEVEQGVGENQDFRSSIQYQLFPKTYIELYTQGQFGNFNQNGIELNWSRDY